MINGLLDHNVPADGGRGGSAWDGTPMRPYIAQGTFWAAANRCSSTPVREVHEKVTIARYSCPDGRRVEAQQVSDNGHAWPGGGRGSRLGDVPSTAMQATEVIWSFFASVQKR
jgi:polyhydroxybutyrate depolymerase